MYILGINAYHGDASATLLKDGAVVLAIEEERLNRKKHCAGFPTLAIKACLEAGKIEIQDVNHFAISVNPSANLQKKIMYSISRFTKIRKMLKDRLTKVAKTRDLRSDLAYHLEVPKDQVRGEVHNVEHHIAHLTSAFYSSPFDEAAILTLDGMGDFVSAKWGLGKGSEMDVLGQVEYPHSIGYLYTAVTQFLGFPYYGDEGKIMGLAPYGNPVYMDEFRKLITTPKKKIGYELNLDYFNHHEKGIDMQWDDGQPSIGLMYSEKMKELLGEPRESGSEYDQKYKDIAASLQLRTEEVCLDMISKLAEKTGSEILCLAGGVALNSVMNGKIRLQTSFKEVYIHPNAGDGGTSLGAAQYVAVQKEQISPEEVPHAYLGVEFSNEEIEQALENVADQVEIQRVDDETLYKETAQYIANELVVGWFQGRMEWGPRALGSRSIVADPRSKRMKDILNSRIKKRESFRPFAPSILEESVGDYFEQNYPAPTMLMVYQVKEEMRETIPAVTHVDGSGRLQTVCKEHHERYYRLIRAFNDLTGVPVVINTSFNENEPIVCSPYEAIDCFLRTNMDVLTIGNFIVTKKEIK
jgi:carbamoyltransferase